MDVWDRHTWYLSGETNWFRIPPLFACPNIGSYILMKKNGYAPIILRQIRWLPNGCIPCWCGFPLFFPHYFPNGIHPFHQTSAFNVCRTTFPEHFPMAFPMTRLDISTIFWTFFGFLDRNSMGFCERHGLAAAATQQLGPWQPWQPWQPWPGEGRGGGAVGHELARSQDEATRWAGIMWAFIHFSTGVTPMGCLFFLWNTYYIYICIYIYVHRRMYMDI